MDNPLGLPAVVGLLEMLQLVSSLALLALIITVAPASLVVRFRRSAGEGRQQLKWFTFAGAIATVYAAVSITYEGVGKPVPRGLILCGMLLFLGVPISIAVAILRYRLYDIDRVITRTVTYTLVTGLLALVYAIGVVLLRPLLEGFAGESDLAVAGSTLAVRWQRCSGRCGDAYSQR
ncbi:MAG TPA: hypothetical protein VHN13_12565 [Candidatus Tectomicrobia bacterium]|nr:hypothetical protein [Candidatus Tectomicrobia bacterium]